VGRVRKDRWKTARRREGKPLWLVPMRFQRREYGGHGGLPLLLVVAGVPAGHFVPLFPI